ncbi:integumentary mucin C.1, partial [Biomphalaria glabrata]
SEVEKAEISLEVTKRNLESCQIDLKMKERQVEKEKEKYEKKCSELTEARTKIKELESKMKDLNVQIRHELMKNENIERGLETIPRLRDEIEEKKVKIKSLEKELTEKTCLLNSSRKCARELKGKLKDVDTQDEKCQSLKEEMELLQNEVTTLKTLMSSKDVLLQQRCQKLDQAKYAVDLLCQTAYSQEEETRLKQINKLLSKLQQLNLRSISQDDPISPKEQSSSWCGQGRSKSAMVRGTHHNHCHDDQQSNKENAVYLDLSDLNNDSSGKRKASKSSSPGSGSLVQRSASFHQITTSRDTTHSAQSKEKRVASPNRSRLSDSPYLCSSFRSTSGIVYTPSRTPKLSSKFRPSLENSLGLNGTTEGRGSSSGAKSERPASSIATSRRSQIQISNNLSNGAETDDSNEQANLAAETLLSKLTRKEKKILSRLSPSQLDSILCYAIQNGDRVSVELDQKPPRYGKKQPKAVQYSGLVKFIGQIETSSSQNESTVYVGILLDEPIGDSDGEYKGVRYMFTPPGYAKFCQLRELDTVLDVSLGVYVPISKLVVTRYQDYISTKVDSGHQVSSSSSSMSGSCFNERGRLTHGRGCQHIPLTLTFRIKKTARTRRSYCTLVCTLQDDVFRSFCDCAKKDTTTTPRETTTPAPTYPSLTITTTTSTTTPPKETPEDKTTPEETTPEPTTFKI